MTDIAQPTARAMLAVLQIVSDRYRTHGALSHGDMKLVWGMLDVAAAEEGGRETYSHQRDLIASLVGLGEATSFSLAAE